jgi:hypothetical protein
VAAAITFDQLQQLPITRYQEIRNQLPHGALLFAAGTYTISRLIQQFTRSPWSHVGIVFSSKSLQRVLLLESVEDMGVRFAPVSKYLDDYENGKPYRGNLVIAQAANVDEALERRIASFGIDQLTKPYDKEEIAEIAVRIALRKGRRDDSGRKFICSELVQACYASGGYEFPADAGGFISPQDIWADSRVALRWRIQ